MIVLESLSAVDRNVETDRTRTSLRDKLRAVVNGNNIRSRTFRSVPTLEKRRKLVQ